MTPRRRQPPLFEALGEAPRRDDSAGAGAPIVHPAAAGHGNGSHVPPAPRAPVVVEAPVRAGMGRAGGPSNRMTVIAFLAAAVVVLFIVVWTLAYKLGERQGQQSVLSHTDPSDAAVITGQNTDQNPNIVLPPGNPPAAVPDKTVKTPVERPPSKPVAPPTAPAAGMPPIVQQDPRKPGNNYLELCPLTWKDAEPAVRYLQANGIRATAIPNNKKVDPAKPEPNNPLLIIVDQPYASGNFKASQAERNALVAEIRRLGKKWQAEHKGASDFADPMWRLQRGK
jgi:hypothetical protein